MENLIEYRCGLIDFQVGRDHGKLNFNPAEYIKSCARSNMKRVIFTCKDAYGDAYYKTELIQINPMTDSNYLKVAIDESKKQNMELYAYFNVLLDDIYAKSHPENRMVTQKGELAISYDYYKALCPNSPYIDTLRERIADLVFNYDIDGIFFDISYLGEDKCYCSHCKAKFFQLYGYELKNDLALGTSEFADFNEFKRLSRGEFLTGLCDTVKEIKSIPVIWNGSGSFYLAEPEIDAYSDYLTTEFHAPNYLDGIIRGKWMQSIGKGFIMSTPSEMGRWGDWTMIPHNTLKSVVCSIAANGGGVFFNHTPYLSGEFDKSYIKCIEENIKESFIYLKKYEDELRNSISAADTAILMSIQSKRFCENGFAGYKLSDFIESLKGSVKMMLESGIAFDIIDEETFCRDTDRYKLIIIPESPCLNLKTIKELVEFSGAVISCGSTGMYNEYGNMQIDYPLHKLFGISFQGFSELSVEYMSDLSETLSDGIPNMPILIKLAGKLPNFIITKDGKVLSKKVVPPFEATFNKHVYHQHEYPYKRSDFISAVKNRNSIYFSANIFKSFYSTASPWLKKIFLNAVKTIHEKPIIKIQAPVCVYSTLMKRDNKYILQLINTNGALCEVVKSFHEETLQIPKIIVMTKLNVKKVYSAINKQSLNFMKKSSLTEIPLDNVGIHTAVIIEIGD